jgi:Zn-dependent peptidase ImmA (M78 family)
MSSASFKLKMAKQKAELFLRENGYSCLPIDPFVIADKLELVVEPIESATDGVSGMLLRHGNTFGIMYATRYRNEGFERFSVAHEIAHFILEGHIDHVLKTGKHESRAGFTSADPYELEADHFAAGLLMPEGLFKAALRNRDSDLGAIEHIAGMCKTSLTATAIRVAELATDAVAVVISTGQSIDYCFMSTAMKSLRQLNFLRKGTRVPIGTETARVNSDPRLVASGERAATEIDVRDWLGGSRSTRVMEEVVGLGRYGKTLTVLSSPDIGNAAAGYEEDDEDERLQETWTSRFRR